MIIIQALKAYAPIPGMIATSIGKPPISRFEVATINEAIIAIESEHTRLTQAGIEYQVNAICYGRKPRGWNQAKNQLIKAFLK